MLSIARWSVIVSQQYGEQNVASFSSKPTFAKGLLCCPCFRKAPQIPPPVFIFGKGSNENDFADALFLGLDSDQQTTSQPVCLSHLWYKRRGFAAPSCYLGIDNHDYVVVIKAPLRGR